MSVTARTLQYCVPLPQKQSINISALVPSQVDATSSGISAQKFSVYESKSLEELKIQIVGCSF